jgi:hypothetical protein
VIVVHVVRRSSSAQIAVNLDVLPCTSPQPPWHPRTVEGRLVVQVFRLCGGLVLATRPFPVWLYRVRRRCGVLVASATWPLPGKPVTRI